MSAGDDNNLSNQSFEVDIDEWYSNHSALIPMSIGTGVSIM